MLYYNTFQIGIIDCVSVDHVIRLKFGQNRSIVLNLTLVFDMFTCSQNSKRTTFYLTEFTEALIDSHDLLLLRNERKKN